MSLLTRARPLGVTGPNVPAAARRPAVAFGLLAIVQIALIAAVTMLTVTLPRIRTDLRLGPADLVLVASAYSLPFGGLLLVGGALAD